MSSPSGNGPPWAIDLDEALRLYGSGRAGLEEAEADRRREEFGPNRLPEKPPRSPWAVAFAQLRGFLNLILIGAALLAGVIGDVKDAVLIGAVVLFNTVLGFLQEHRAERTLAALKAMVALRARVLRDGRARGGRLPTSSSPATSFSSRRATGFPPMGG